MYFLSINHVRPDASSEELGKIIPLHVAWTRKQIESGSIAQAGKWGEAGGMAIVKAGDLRAAEKLLKDDPLVASGMVDCETGQLYPDVPIE